MFGAYVLQMYVGFTATHDNIIYLKFIEKLSFPNNFSMIINHKISITASLLQSVFNPLSANPAKWSNTLKQFVGKLLTTCLSVFDHFVKLALKDFRISVQSDILVKDK